MTVQIVNPGLGPNVQLAGVPGPPGPPGPPGSGSTIIVKDEGSLLASNIATLNFIGAGVTATLSGTTANVTIPGGGTGTGSGEIIYLADHGVVADGTTTNSHAAIEALIAATANGAIIHFPLGTTKLDGPIIPTKPCIFRGYGGAKGQSSGNGKTMLLAPAGFPAFVLDPNAQETRVEDMKIKQVSLLATTGTASYAPGTSVTAITGCTLLDISNGQVIRLEGAGGSMTLIGRTAAVSSGSNSVAVNQVGDFGNYYYYSGQMVSIAGAGAGGAALVGYIGTLGVTGDFTLVNAAGAALNASTTVTTAAITVYSPLVARVTAGGGTATLTIDSYPFNPQAVTSAKISHCAPAIYSKTQFHGRFIEVAGDAQAGIVISGRTTGSEVADNGTFFACMFAADFGGVIFQGNDAQVNSFYGCDFAGPKIGVLDNGLLGNYFYGCHWAFNCGFQFYNQFSQIQGGYVESNTGWAAAGGFFAYTMSLQNGGGLNGFAPYGGWMTAPRMYHSGPIYAKDDGSGENAAAELQGGIRSWGSGNVAIYNGNGNTDATGNNLLLFANLTIGFYIQTSSDMRLNSTAGDIQFRRADTIVASVISTGLDIVSGKSLSVAGNKVVGGRGASLPVDATDLATAIALVNAIKARLKVTGGHGLVAD